MKKTFSYSRKLRVPIPGDQYNSVEYFLSASVEYSDEDVESMTIIDKHEVRILAEFVNEEQRNIIKKEMQIEKLPMDKFTDKVSSIKRKIKFKR